MKIRLLAATLPLVAATPAAATASGNCTVTGNPRLRVELVIGHLAASVLAQVRIIDGPQRFQSGDADGPVLAQAWIDDGALKFDLAGPGGDGHLARLRTWRQRGRGDYMGSLTYGGRRYRVRCRIEG